MNTDKNIQAVNGIRKVTVLAMVINIVLSVVKITVGFAVSSMALVADGLHSVSDMATDFAVLLGARMGTKAPDSKHPYGHAWAETFATIFVAAALSVVGCMMIYRSAESIASRQSSNIGMTVFLIAVVSVIAKEFVYRVTKKMALKLSSTMLYANAWHHRSDAFSSIAVAAGAIASMAGVKYADQFTAIIVGIMIVVVAAKIFRDSIGQFTARAVDSDTSSKIVGIISSQPDIRCWHKLRTRTVGRELFMDLHIEVDPQLNITCAHNISSQLEAKLHADISQPINITVHIEPDLGGNKP